MKNKKQLCGVIRCCVCNRSSGTLRKVKGRYYCTSCIQKIVQWYNLTKGPEERVTADSLVEKE